MKRQLVDALRHVLRLLPIPVTLKRSLQHRAFKYFPFLFRHMAAYQWWVMQHPDLAAEALTQADILQKREEAEQSGLYQPQGPSVLMISHSLGGGTEYHLKQLADKLRAEGVKVWSLRSVARKWVQICDMDAEDGAPGFICHPQEEFDLLASKLHELQVRHIHLHHLVDFDETFRATLLKLCERLEVPFDFTAHDYLSICPRFTLYDQAVRGYCGEPDVRRCQGCVSRFGSTVGKEVDVEKWRQDYAEFLGHARHIFTPDEDVQSRLRRYLPGASILNRPHWDEMPIQPLPRSPRQPGRPLRIMTLGGIAPHKGSRVLEQCAADAKNRKLPLEFTLIGYSDIDWELKKVMKVTGRYTQNELPQMLRDGGYDMVFLPAVWPETFNYTLSEILHFGLYPVCFDIGAIARRVKAMGFGTVLPYRYYRDAAAVNDALLKIEIPAEAPIEKLKAAQVRYDSFVEGYYGLDNLR